MTVVAIQATDIPKMGFLSKTDPYLVMKISSDAAEYRTKYCDDTLAPVWNQRFDFNIINLGADYLIIQLKDWNTVDQHKIISRLEVPLRTIPVGRMNDIWFDMIPCIDKPKGGKIRLLIEITDTYNQRPPVQRPPFNNQPPPPQPQPVYAPPPFRPPMNFPPPSPQQVQYAYFPPQRPEYGQYPPMPPPMFVVQAPMAPQMGPPVMPSPRPMPPQMNQYVRPEPNPYAMQAEAGQNAPPKNFAWFNHPGQY